MPDGPERPASLMRVGKTATQVELHERTYEQYVTHQQFEARPFEARQREHEREFFAKRYPLIADWHAAAMQTAHDSVTVDVPLAVYEGTSLLRPIIKELLRIHFYEDLLFKIQCETARRHLTPNPSEEPKDMSHGKSTDPALNRAQMNEPAFSRKDHAYWAEELSLERVVDKAGCTKRDSLEGKAMALSALIHTLIEHDRRPPKDWVTRACKKHGVDEVIAAFRTAVQMLEKVPDAHLTYPDIESGTESGALVLPTSMDLADYNAHDVLITAREHFVGEFMRHETMREMFPCPTLKMRTQLEAVARVAAKCNQRFELAITVDRLINLLQEFTVDRVLDYVSSLYRAAKSHRFYETCGGSTAELMKSMTAERVLNEPWVDASLGLPGPDYRWARRGERLGPGAKVWDKDAQEWQVCGGGLSCAEDFEVHASGKIPIIVWRPEEPTTIPAGTIIQSGRMPSQPQYQRWPDSKQRAVLKAIIGEAPGKVERVEHDHDHDHDGYNYAQLEARIYATVLGDNMPNENLDVLPPFIIRTATASSYEQVEQDFKAALAAVRADPTAWIVSSGAIVFETVSPASAMNLRELGSDGDIVRDTDLIAVSLSESTGSAFIPLSTPAGEEHLAKVGFLLKNVKGRAARHFDPKFHRPIRPWFDGLRMLDTGEVLHEGDVYANLDPWTWWAACLSTWHDDIPLEDGIEHVFGQYERLKSRAETRPYYARSVAKLFRGALERIPDKRRDRDSEVVAKALFNILVAEKSPSTGVPRLPDLTLKQVESWWRAWRSHEAEVIDAWASRVQGALGETVPDHDESGTSKFMRPLGYADFPLPPALDLAELDPYQRQRAKLAELDLEAHEGYDICDTRIEDPEVVVLKKEVPASYDDQTGEDVAELL